MTQTSTPLLRSHVSHHESSFTEIYRDDINIAIWQRDLDNSIKKATEDVISKKCNLQFSSVVYSQCVMDLLEPEFHQVKEASYLLKDIAKLVDMFCYLFDLKKTGLRLQVLDKAMCPRFHVDNVPCRLVTTYHGNGTQWLPDHLVDRSKLGAGSNGLADKHSGIFQHQKHIRQLKPGDVALLKGEGWITNQGGGLVHRSPNSCLNDRRLLLTLDFCDS